MLFVYAHHTRNIHNGVRMINKHIKFDDHMNGQINAFCEKYTMSFSAAIRYLCRKGMDKHELEAAKPSQSIEIGEE